MRALLIIISILSLLSCSAKQGIETVKVEDLNSGVKLDNNIFANLAKTDSGYKFKGFMLGFKTTNGNWVNLKTGKPTWNIVPKRCGKGIVKDRNKDVPDCDAVVDESKFLVANFDEGDAAIRVISAPLFAGLTLTGASYNVVFDVESYVEAYKEAFSKINKQKLRKIDRKISAIRGEFLNKKEKYISIVKNFQVNYNSINKSGFENIDYKKNFSFVHVSPNDEIESLWANYYNSNSVSQNLNSLQIFIDNNYKLFKNRLSDLINKVDVECNIPQSKYLNYQLRCPKSASIDSGNLEINITLESLNFYNVMPEKITAQDENILVSIKGNKINIYNFSKKFITVKNLSVYYDNKIASYKTNISMPPDSTLLEDRKIDIALFDINWNILTFRNITKHKAENTKIKYGIACEYVTSDSNENSSLYKSKFYPLYNLIKDKIQKIGLN